jgi:hypothetical protein
MKRMETFQIRRPVLWVISCMIICMAPLRAFAAVEAAVLSLLISPSPGANAMGGTYANTVGTSPMAAIMNPASLGMFARNNFFGTEYYPKKVTWLPSLISDMTYDATATGFGINLKSFLKIPVSVGVGFYRIRFDMGEQTYTGPDGPEPLGTFHSWEQSTGTTVSAALDYYVRAAVGITWKSIEVRYWPTGVDWIQSPEVKPKAHDLGIILQVPVLDLVERFVKIQPGEGFGPFHPYLDPGFYYSKTNIGKSVYFIDPDQADPLPRNLSLGVSVSAGLNYKKEGVELPLFAFKWAREVDDILIDRLPDYSKKYASGLHDIRFFKDVIEGRTNPRVITKHGYETGVLDFLYFREGRYVDLDGQLIYKTEGYGINYTRPFRLLASAFHLDRSLVVRLLTCIRFEEQTSKYTSSGYWSPIKGTKFKSYSIGLDNSFLELFKPEP